MQQSYVFQHSYNYMYVQCNKYQKLFVKTLFISILKSSQITF